MHHSNSASHRACLCITVTARSTILSVWCALQSDHSIHSDKEAGQTQHLHAWWHGRQKEQGQGARQQGISKG